MGHCYARWSWAGSAHPPQRQKGPAVSRKMWQGSEMLYLGFPGGGCWVAAMVAGLRLAVAGARVDISGPRDRAVTGCRPPSVGFATSSPAVGIRRSHQQHRDDLHLCDGQDTLWMPGVLPISEINLQGSSHLALLSIRNFLWDTL